jgi:hypothetical protein
MSETKTAPETAHVTNFIRQRVEQDLADAK